MKFFRGVIVKAIKESLFFNNIEFREYSYIPTLDKRTGKIYKRSYSIRIQKQEDIKFLREKGFVRK